MSFIEHFSIIEDPRMNINKKYELLDIIFLTATAVMSGADGWQEIKLFGDHKLDWLRQYRPFKEGIPVDDTIARIISAISPEALTNGFIAWVNELRQKNDSEQIAIDGKTLRRSFDGDRMSALHSITAWSHENGLVLAQMKSKGKKNENESVMELLDKLELENKVVTVDAMNTQKPIAKKIRERKGDYILNVKNNHKRFKSEIAAYFHKTERDEKTLYNENYYEEVDSGHGRIETRTCRVLPISTWIDGHADWKDIQCVIEINRKREMKNKISEETQYYISSLKPDAKKIANSVRNHWGVENKVHWILDVVYGEDDSRLRREHSAENIGVMRRLALNMAKLHPEKGSMKGKLQKAMWSDEFRSELLDGQKLCEV